LLGASLLMATLLHPQMPAQQPSEEVVPQARAILTAIVAGDFAQVEKQFTDEMKAGLPPGALAARWAKLLAQAGGYKSCGTEPRVVKINDKQMVIIPCEFERMTIDVQFAFDSAGRISGLVFRPSARTAAAYTLPSYANPSSFIESEITVGPSEWPLPATLTLPAGAGPWPGVVLVHGSGPNDRDETVGANKPFKDLAAGLASRGIAVLRYDKRTMVHRHKITALGLHRQTGSHRRCPRGRRCARRRSSTLHSYPALNHLFIAGSGPSLPAEYQIPGHVAEDVVRDIAAWIGKDQ
jgi:hypothetical protein